MRPSLSEWTHSLSAPLSNFDSRSVRGSVSGPLVAGRVGISGSIGYERRAGFTFNRVTGHDVDSREGLTGKGQVLWTPSSVWETRLIVTGERARDGDFALNDLGGLRENPFEVARDFEGHTDRDIVATTLPDAESRRPNDPLDDHRVRAVEDPGTRPTWTTRRSRF